MNPDAPSIAVRDEVVHFFGDFAVVLCREIVQGSLVEATNIFVHEDGVWRMVHHHASDVAQFVARTLDDDDPLADRRN